LRVKTNSPIGKRLLLLFFAAAFLIYTAAANSSRLIVSPWLFGEWLVSYGGGFSRRGLAGSLIIEISDLVNLNPLWTVFVFQLLLAGAFLILLYLKVTFEALPLGVMVALLSPMAFLYFLVDPGGVAGRKEYALFLIAIIWFRFQSQYHQSEKVGVRHTIAFIFFGIAIGALLLTHEGFLFFLPLLLIPLILSWLTGAKISLGWVLASFSALTVPSLVSVWAILNKGSNPTYSQMCEPLTSRQVPERICEGAIAWSVNTGSSGLEFALKQTTQLLQGYTLYFFVGAVTALLLFASLRSLPLIYLGREQRIAAPIIIGALVVVSIPLFVIAHDWGRYISVSATLISLGLLFSYSSKDSRGVEYLQLSVNGWPSPRNKTRLILTLAGIWFFLGVRSYAGDYLSIAYTWAATIYLALR
jgi:hypothetical protein